MKRSIVLITMLFTINVFSQENTLINTKISSTGVFGGPIVKYTNIDQNGSVLLGVRGGYIINHSLIVGIGMYGLVSDVMPAVEKIDERISFDDKLRLMYGGIEMGYVFEPLDLLHFSLNTLFGVGNVSYNNTTESDAIGGGHHTGESFFVIEPNAGLELNLTNFMRLETVISYRISTGLKYPYLSNNNISGVGGMLTLKFGQF
jgi:hypothetical protein